MSIAVELFIPYLKGFDQWSRPERRLGMRRKDREITAIEDLEEIVKSCRVCRLGLWDGHEPYVLPLNFGYERTDAGWVFYFHSAKEGRKLDILRDYPAVALEMDGGHALREGAVACEYGYAYFSAMGVGRAELVEDIDEKQHALSLIMLHQTGKVFDFTPGMTEAVAVIKVTVQRLTGKRCPAR